MEFQVILNGDASAKFSFSVIVCVVLIESVVHQIPTIIATKNITVIAAIILRVDSGFCKIVSKISFARRIITYLWSC